MPAFDAYLAFLGALLAYQLAGPGPDMILVITHGIAQGRRLALAAALGCVSAGIVQIPLLAFGLATVIATSPLAHGLLRLGGAAYLGYIGAKLLVTSSKPADQQVALAQSSTAFAAFRRGFVSNLSNPQTLAFMLALLPQFVTPGAAPLAMQFIVLGITMKAVGLVVLGTVAIASGSVGGWLGRRPGILAWQMRGAGLVMIGLAFYMAFSELGRVGEA
jgi:threonine/homoserine/homoserine lactone efflux protein